MKIATSRALSAGREGKRGGDGSARRGPSQQTAVSSAARAWQGRADASRGRTLPRAVMLSTQNAWSAGSSLATGDELTPARRAGRRYRRYEQHRRGEPRRGGRRSTTRTPTRRRSARRWRDVAFTLSFRAARRLHTGPRATRLRAARRAEGRLRGCPKSNSNGSSSHRRSSSSSDGSSGSSGDPVGVSKNRQERHGTGRGYAT